MPPRAYCSKGHMLPVDAAGEPLEEDSCPLCQKQAAASTDDHSELDATESFLGNRTAISGQQPATFPPFHGYEVLERLGEGGMGTVFKARHIAANRIVALKMIRVERLGEDRSTRSIERFRVEVQAAARLEHDHIVPIYEVGEERGSPYYTMRLIEGYSLSHRLSQGPLDSRTAANYLAPVARSLEMAHAEGIVHRDLKPANLLVDERSERLMLTDFGLAKLGESSQLTLDGQVFGSPPYMSPEQALGKEAGPATDIYSLGATLYQMLTGRPPFQGQTIPQTLKMVVESQPVAPRSLNPVIERDLETICLKCLEKEPRKRYRTAGELADDLERYLNHQPVSAQPIGPLTRGGRWCRRNPLITVACLFVASLLLAGGTWYATRPAYLQLQVAPEEANVALDGEIIELRDGYALIPSTPGRHRISITAEGFQSREEPIVLARGRENLAVLNANLVELRGRLHLQTIPAGAQVTLLDGDGVVVAQGMSPFISQPLDTGSYTAIVTKPLFQNVEQTVEIPAGNETAELAPLQLEPVSEAASRYGTLQRLHGQLHVPVEEWQLPAGGVPLDQLVKQLQAQYRIQIDIDERTLDEEGIPTDYSIEGRIPAGSFYRSVNFLLKSEDLVLSPVLSSEQPHVELTTFIGAEYDLVSIQYPAGQLVSFRGGDWDQLIETIQSHASENAGVSPGIWHEVGGSASMRVHQASQSLVITAPMTAQLELLEVFEELRRNALAVADEDRAFEEVEREAVTAARLWLRHVDQNDGGACMQNASAAFRQAFTVEKWQKTLNDITGSLEKLPLESTRQNDRSYMFGQHAPVVSANGIAEKGMHLVFETQDPQYLVFEQIQMIKEEDTWRVNGYYVTAQKNPVAELNLEDFLPEEPQAETP